jgi:hypothetical protein
MLQKRGLDLEGAELVAAALDDVHAQTAHDAVVATLKHRHVARAEPAIFKTLLRGLSAVPIG